MAGLMKCLNGMNLRHRKSVRHAGYLQHYRAEGPTDPLLQWPIFTRKSLAGFARKLTTESVERYTGNDLESTDS